MDMPKHKTTCEHHWYPTIRPCTCDESLHGRNKQLGESIQLNRELAAAAAKAQTVAVDAMALAQYIVQANETGELPHGILGDEANSEWLAILAMAKHTLGKAA